MRAAGRICGAAKLAMDEQANHRIRAGMDWAFPGDTQYPRPSSH